MTLALFSPITLGSLALPNRIIASPMCQYSCVDGVPQAWHSMHIGNLAASGVGLVLLEATGVTPEGRITPHCLGLYNDENERALGKVLEGVRSYTSTPIGIQLGHAGRKASCAAPWQGGGQLAVAQGGWQTQAPSAIPHNENDLPPHALSIEELVGVREAFVQAAKRATRIGLQAIEVHAAHGYLLHQFLSPLSNHRTDSYGGSLQNRLRFPLEVFDAVRDAVPAQIPVGIRISATDWVDEGWSLEGTLELCAELRQRDCDWIDVSSGGLSPNQKIALQPGYQVPFARAVRESSGLPVMAVGLITEAQQAENILQAGDADMVAIARALLWDPRWPWHAAAELGATLSAPPQYWRCPPHGKSTIFDM
jgi:2,4-dienoyl-CoA reductase-like NADH-dependent reductase (Old Yellow Enzyme family)